MTGNLETYADPPAAAKACAGYIAAAIEEATATEGLATLAVSGGSTPALLFDGLAQMAIDWSRVHLFWVDERAVAPTDPQSNYRLAAERLIRPAQIPPANVHRIQAELAPEEAAARYVAEIRGFFGLAEAEHPQFDVIQLGMGSDAHTASLFPGHPLIQDRERIAAALYVEKLGASRITLLPGPLAAAKNSMFLVTGGDKAEALRSVFHEPYDPMRLPAQLPSRLGKRVRWFVDEAAARLAGG